MLKNSLKPEHFNETLYGENWDFADHLLNPEIR